MCKNRERVTYVIMCVSYTSSDICVTELLHRVFIVKFARAWFWGQWPFPFISITNIEDIMAIITVMTHAHPGGMHLLYYSNNQ